MPLEMSPGADTCPVCGGAAGRSVYPQARDPITSDVFQVVECAACRIVYTSPRPALADRYYPQSYRAYGPLVSRALGIFYNQRVSRWAQGSPRPGRVLEIGCGPGWMLNSFRKRGWTALGIERNETVAEWARRAHGLDVVSTPVEDLPSDRQFNLIILFQVLEHIAEPLSLLRECAQRLAPGGRVIINVPNFASWQSEFARSMWLHLDVPRHLVHYTPETLAATLERAGLTLAGLRFASPEHDPYGWVESTLSRATGRPNILTRFLMGLDPLGPAVIFSIAAGALLAVPATLLAIASWLATRGALMEAIAVRQGDAAVDRPRNHG